MAVNPAGWLLRKARSTAGNAFTGIASAYLERGLFEKSVKACRRSIKLFEAAQDRGGLSCALSNLGNAMLLNGRWEEARRYGLLSLEVDSEGAVGALILLGSVEMAEGRFSAALQYFEKSLALGRRTNDKHTEAKALGSISNIYSDLGLLGEAISYGEEVLQLEITRRNHAGAMEAMFALGVKFGNFGDKRAFDCFQTVLRGTHGTPLLGLEAAALAALGTLSMQTDLESAASYLSRAQFLYETADDPLGQLDLLCRQGELHAAANRGDLAEQCWLKAVRQYRETGRIMEEAKALTSLGAFYLEADRSADAEEKLRRAMDLCGEVHAYLMREDRLKIALGDQTHEAGSHLQDALISQGKHAEALEIAERGRTQAFVELLKRRFNATDVIQPSSPTVEEMKRFAQETGSTLVEYSFIRSPRRLHGVRTQRERLVVWVVRPDGSIITRFLKAVPSGIPETAIAQFPTSWGTESDNRKIWWEPDVNRFDEALLERWYEWLIEPIKAALPSDTSQTVIFVPHDKLFIVPFPALRDADGVYLIERHAIMTAPSIQALIEISAQASRKQAGAGALVVGDPEMPFVGDGERCVRLPGLPYAREEARSIAAILGTSPLLGKAATKARVLEEAPSKKIVHLATHGLLGSLRGAGMPGAIALAPEAEDDGLLHSEEWMHVKLKADLVVLSACETARGRITADGVIGLSRALLFAGSDAVLVALWAVPDEETARLMLDFYRAYLNPNCPGDKAAALRRAMCLAIATGTSPHAWAAFTLIGKRWTF